MNDLEHRLSALGRPGADPDSGAGAGADAGSAVAGDLARARRAARERRARRTALGGIGALGVAAAVGIGIGAHSSSTPERSAGDRPATHRTAGAPTPTPTHHETHHGTHHGHPRHHRATTAPTVSAADMHLVAYRGEQEPGFTVTYVPAGFEVEGQDDVVLAVARPGDTTPISSFVDKMVVTVQTEATHRELDRPGTPVDIGGDPGTLTHTPDGAATLLDYHDGHRWIEVQVWNGIGLTDHDIVTFARGLTVSPDVETVS